MADGEAFVGVEGQACHGPEEDALVVADGIAVEDEHLAGHLMGGP